MEEIKIDTSSSIMLPSTSMTTQKKRSAKKGAGKTTKTRGNGGVGVSDGVQVDCVKCGAHYVARGTTQPRRCARCTNTQYDEPARKGPLVKSSQRRYAKLHGMSVAEVREKFPEIGK